MNKQLIINQLALLVLLFAACKNDMMTEQTKTVAGQNWAYADSLRFDFDLLDTGFVHNLFVDVVHAEGYPFENVYVKIHTILPSGKRLSKTRSLQLSGPAGEWIGSGSGEKISARLMLQERTFFREQGRYSLIFEQWMRQDSLPGIRAIGLAVQKTDEKRK